ncbi:hypothetical protein BHM03_00030298 [Ensete ventricosum]|nr:hypothetical protein BHM03_00030298 [Ensete ventricosum]
MVTPWRAVEEPRSVVVRMEAVPQRWFCCLATRPRWTTAREVSEKANLRSRGTAPTLSPEKGEHGDIHEVAADTEADDRRGLGEGAKSGEARGGDAAARRDAASFVAFAACRRRSDRRRGRGSGRCREVIKLSLDSGKKKKSNLSYRERCGRGRRRRGSGGCGRR